MTEMTREQIIEAFTKNLDMLLEGIAEDTSVSAISTPIGHIAIPALNDCLVEVNLSLVVDVFEWDDKDYAREYDPAFAVEYDEFTRRNEEARDFNCAIYQITKESKQ